MPASPPLAFDRDFDPQAGEAIPIASGLVRVTAPNASAYTFTGTNSYLIGTERVFVVDPGPDDDRHLEALLRAVDGRAVEAVILTHTHHDHSALSRRLTQALDAPLWFPGPHRLPRPGVPFEPIDGIENWENLPGKLIVDGDRLELGAMSIEVIATPGHCANHVAFGIVGTPDLLIGDHIMAWSSSLITRDGLLSDYFTSLDRVIDLPYLRYHPGHGGPVANGPAHAQALRAHRHWRNTEILSMVEKADTTVPDLVATIYPKVRPPLTGAARATVIAHVNYLAAAGQLSVEGETVRSAARGAVSAGP
jgi:glyoxylase-like metal-dependent hydrolase (beta-lactamase superfamily II)